MRWPAFRSEFGCSRMSSRSPRSMWKTMSSNPIPRSALSFACSRQLRRSTSPPSASHDVCLRGTRWHRLWCARQCAQKRPKSVIRRPTPTTKQIKNGPEIVNFRPVLRFLAALANRRLQPLGHLTVSKLLAILTIRRRRNRLCRSLCSSSPNLRSSVHLDGGFADHRGSTIASRRASRHCLAPWNESACLPECSLKIGCRWRLVAYAPVDDGSRFSSRTALRCPSAISDSFRQFQFIDRPPWPREET